MCVCGVPGIHTQVRGTVSAHLGSSFDSLMEGLVSEEDRKAGRPVTHEVSRYEEKGTATAPACTCHDVQLPVPNRPRLASLSRFRAKTRPRPLVS